MYKSLNNEDTIYRRSNPFSLLAMTISLPIAIYYGIYANFIFLFTFKGNTIPLATACVYIYTSEYIRERIFKFKIDKQNGLIPSYRLPHS